MASKNLRELEEAKKKFAKTVSEAKPTVFVKENPFLSAGAALALGLALGLGGRSLKKYLFFSPAAANYLLGYLAQK